MDTVLALRSQVTMLGTACDEVRHTMGRAHAQMQQELEHRLDVQRKARATAESRARKLELELNHWKEEMQNREKVRELTAPRVAFDPDPYIHCYVCQLV
jgi:hypothetical protein